MDSFKNLNPNPEKEIKITNCKWKGKEAPLQYLNKLGIQK